MTRKIILILSSHVDTKKMKCWKEKKIQSDGCAFRERDVVFFVTN